MLSNSQFDIYNCIFPFAVLLEPFSLIATQQISQLTSLAPLPPPAAMSPNNANSNPNEGPVVSPTNAPPRYTDTPVTEPLLHPGDAPAPRGSQDSIDRDFLPDDFKYSGSVSGSHLSIRQAFVRKVYTILGLQLLLTFGVGSFISLNPTVRAWSLSNQWLFWVALFGSFALLIGTYLCQRSYPKNLIFLFGFTLCESYIVGLVTSLYDTRIVLEALVITLVVFLGLSLFAIQTKYDFTGWSGYLGGLLWFLIAFGLCLMFFPGSSKLELIYAGIGAFVFCIYILVDTQQIMDNYHPEDEIPAAIALYLDLVNLFLYILSILQQTNDN